MVADELVDEASITDGRAIVKFTRTEAALADLRTRFKDATFDLTTTKGDTAARQARRELVSLRTGLDKRRKELALPAVEFKRRIDSEAQRITAEITTLEEPIDLQIKQDEQRREDERIARLRAEEQRCDSHRDRIKAIRDVALRAVGMSSAEIEAKVALVSRVVIDESYEEFQALAVNEKAATLTSLAELLSNTRQTEAREEENRIARERLAQLERENTERQAREAAERRAREAAEAEQRRIEQERMDVERRAQQKRAAQSQAASELISEINRVQMRALNSSSAGMLELAILVEAINPGDALGDFVGAVQKAKDDALHSLHNAHRIALGREADAKRVREEQAEAQRKIDEQAADLQARVDAMNREELRMQAIERENEQAEPIEPEPAPVEPPPVPPVEVVGLQLTGKSGFDALEFVTGPGPVAAPASDVDFGRTRDCTLVTAVAAVMKAATPTSARGRKPGPWVVPLAEMLALKAALRAEMLPGGQFYAEDGTLMNADGSIFDDVDA